MRQSAVVAAVFDNADLLAAVCQARRPPTSTSDETAADLKSQILRMVRSMLVSRAFCQAAQGALFELVECVKLTLARYQNAALRHMVKEIPMSDALRSNEECSIPPDDRILAWHRTAEYAEYGTLAHALYGVPWYCALVPTIGSAGALDQHLAIMQPETIQHLWLALTRGSLWQGTGLQLPPAPVLGAWYEHPYEWCRPTRARDNVVRTCPYVPKGFWLPYTPEDAIVEVAFGRKAEKADRSGYAVFARPQVATYPRPVDWFVVDLFTQLRIQNKGERWFTNLTKFFVRRDAALAKLNKNHKLPKSEIFMVRMPVTRFLHPLADSKGVMPLRDATIAQIFGITDNEAYRLAENGRTMRRQPQQLFNQGKHRRLADRDAFSPSTNVT